MKQLLVLMLFSFPLISQATWAPYCSSKTQQKQIIAYLGADSQWDINNEDLIKLNHQLDKVDVVNYAFIRLSKDGNQNIIPQLTTLDVKNIERLRQLKPNLPIMIAIGGWGDREGFSTFVNDPYKRTVFIQTVTALLKQYQLDGIDIDWENEHLASPDEINNIATLMQELKANIGEAGYCISNAVPGTSAYWKQYPHAKLWKDAVNWTTVMAYDNYGTFGPKTELGSALYESDRSNVNDYPYPLTSGDKAVSHYHKQGLTAEKIILGIPFYCHSYYVDANAINWQSSTPGLHVAVLDPNISSQVSYVDAWTTYGKQLFTYSQPSQKKNQTNHYGLIPLEHTPVYRFMSCDSPTTIASKMAYIKGDSKQGVEIGGASFWSLQQDLPIEDPNSLLRAIYNTLKQIGNSSND